MRIFRTLEVVGKTCRVATALSGVSEKIPTPIGRNLQSVSLTEQLEMQAKLGKTGGLLWLSRLLIYYSPETR